MRLLYLLILFVPLISTGQVFEIDSTCLCNGIEIKPNKNGNIIVEFMAEYPGGDKALKNYLNTNLTSNETDSGRIVLSFFISCKGTTCGYKVEKIVGSLSQETVNEIVSALKRITIWKPAKQRDKIVEIPFGVHFRINKGKIQ